MGHETGAELLSLKGHTNGVRGAAFSPDGSHVVTASQDNTARVWDSADGVRATNFQGAHQSRRFGGVPSPDGSRSLITASHDGTARVWDTTAPNSSA